MKGINFPLWKYGAEPPLCANMWKVVKPDGKSVYGGMRDIVAEARKYGLNAIYDRKRKIWRKFNERGVLESPPKQRSRSSN